MLVSTPVLSSSKFFILFNIGEGKTHIYRGMVPRSVVDEVSKR